MKGRIDHKPHSMDVNAWWYEDKHGVLIVIKSDPATRQVRISWRALLYAAQRCGALPKDK